MTTRMCPRSTRRRPPHPLRGLAGLLALSAGLSACAGDAPPREAPSASEPAGVATIPAAPTEPCVYVTPETPDGPPEGWSQESQELLLTWSIPVIEALALGEDGFTVGYSPPTVTVLTPEPLPASLDQLVADAAAAGVRITWQETRYDQRELEQLSVALLDALPESLDGITGAGPMTAAAGLRVLTEVELDDAGCAEVRRVAEQVAPGVPLTFEVTGEIVRLAEVVEVPAP